MINTKQSKYKVLWNWKTYYIVFWKAKTFSKGPYWFYNASKERQNRIYLGLISEPRDGAKSLNFIFGRFWLQFSNVFDTNKLQKQLIREGE